MPTYSDAPSGIPRPGTVVKVAMSVVVGLTLAFAVGIHWAGVGADAFELFCGNTLAILHGQLWRLFTASLLQSPNSLWPLLEPAHGAVLLRRSSGTAVGRQALRAAS